MRNDGGRGEALLLTVEQAADRLGLGRTKTYQLMWSGEIEAVKIGRSVRVPVASLDQFVERLRSESRT
jgi:excisionase family DNA binding protein